MISQGVTNKRNCAHLSPLQKLEGTLSEWKIDLLVLNLIVVESEVCPRPQTCRLLVERILPGASCRLVREKALALA